MAGYRIGAMAADPGLLRETLKIADCVALCPSHIGQLAALYCLDHLDDWKRKYRRTVRDRVAYAARRIREANTGFEVASSGGYFVYLRHPWDRPHLRRCRPQPRPGPRHPLPRRRHVRPRPGPLPPPRLRQRRLAEDRRTGRAARELGRDWLAGAMGAWPLRFEFSIDMNYPRMESQPRFFVSADWSKDPRKRSVYVADLSKRLIYRETRPDWALGSLMALAGQLSEQGSVLVGVDPGPGSAAELLGVGAR